MFKYNSENKCGRQFDSKLGEALLARGQSTASETPAALVMPSRFAAIAAINQHAILA